MPVQDWMSKDLITIDEDASIIKASKLMQQNNIQHLPVLQKGRLAGIVSDRDLKEAQPSKATSLEVHELGYLLERVLVKEVMPQTLSTISAADTVEKAAAVMLKNKISALPVVSPQGELQGIITKGDIFRAFVSISGIHQGGCALGFELPDEPGSIKEVTDVIRAHGGRLVSILTGYEQAPQGFRHVFIRTKDVRDDQALVAELAGKHKVLYHVHEELS